MKTWRDELIHQAWDALAKQQDRIGKPFHTVLRFRIDHPNMRSAQIAEQLSGQFGARVTAFWVRQSLHRAREKFIDFLIETVEATMSRPTIEELESELGELGLLTFCGPALERRRGKN